jgi:hypothetical protein
VIHELHEQIEDEGFDIKFDEFENLIKFDLFTSKEVALIRVRSLQLSIVIVKLTLSVSLPNLLPCVWILSLLRIICVIRRRSNERFRGRRHF